jgi:hypothetical protein
MGNAINYRRIPHALLSFAAFMIAGSVVRSLMVGHPAIMFMSDTNTTPTPTAIHDKLVQGAAQAKASFPQKLDDITTQTAMLVDGMMVTYVYDLDGVITDAGALRKGLADKVCSTSETSGLIRLGVTLQYEYHDATSKAVLASFKFTSCPA